MISKAKMKEALETIQIVIGMLKSANDEQRFDHLIEGQEIAQIVLTNLSERKPRQKRQQPAVQATEITQKPEETIKTEDELLQFKSGKISPLKPTDVGMGTRRGHGGKVSPAK